MDSDSSDRDWGRTRTLALIHEEDEISDELSDLSCGGASESVRSMYVDLLDLPSGIEDAMSAGSFRTEDIENLPELPLLKFAKRLMSDSSFDEFPDGVPFRLKQGFY